MAAKQKTRCYECGGEEVRYKCPGCGAASCCMACSKAHVERGECSGSPAQVQSQHLKMSQMKHSDLVSDLGFLSSIGSAVTQARKEASNADRRSKKSKGSESLRILRRAAANPKRRVDLQTLPHPMAKRRCNTSFYHTMSDRIYWRVEYALHLCSSTVDELSFLCQLISSSSSSSSDLPAVADSALSTSSSSVFADASSISVLGSSRENQPSSSDLYSPSSPSYSRPSPAGGPSGGGRREEQPSPPVMSQAAEGVTVLLTAPKQDEAVTVRDGFLALLRQVLSSSALEDGCYPVLRALEAAKLACSGLRYYLRLEPCAGSDRRYFVLDGASAIAEALRDRRVVEFPTIHVCLSLQQGCAHFPEETADVHSMIMPQL